MNAFFKFFLIVVPLATVGLVANAQTPGALAPGAPMMQHERMDPAKMRERMAKHQEELKVSARAGQRSAELAKRAAAVKNFYWVLNHDQQKIFDAETLRHFPGIRKPGHPG